MYSLSSWGKVEGLIMSISKSKACDEKGPSTAGAVFPQARGGPIRLT